MFFSRTSYRARRRVPKYQGSNEPITEAFKALRKAGYFARQNFWCCSTCAWYDVPDEKAKHVVFFNKQAGERLGRTGMTHLQWAGNSKFICDTLEAAGLKVKHDGKESSAIEIALPGVDFPPEPKQYDPMDTGEVVWG